MKYFVLRCAGNSGATAAALLPDNSFPSSWITGARFAEGPQEPIELFWDPQTEHGEMVAFYDLGPVLMRNDLVAALKDCGVDNFDTYSVVVRSGSGREVRHEYVAVNIVGAIAAADMIQSDVEDASDGLLDVLFSSLVIDEKRVRGQLMFRSVESIRTILVHETVMRTLLNKGGFGLTFTDTRDFWR